MAKGDEKSIRQNKPGEGVKTTLYREGGASKKNKAVPFNTNSDGPTVEDPASSHRTFHPEEEENSAAWSSSRHSETGESTIVQTETTEQLPKNSPYRTKHVSNTTFTKGSFKNTVLNFGPGNVNVNKKTFFGDPRRHTSNTKVTSDNTVEVRKRRPSQDTLERLKSFTANAQPRLSAEKESKVPAPVPPVDPGLQVLQYFAMFCIFTLILVAVYMLFTKTGFIHISGNQGATITAAGNTVNG
ncbi:uncharacterized protein LOC143464460 isoform X1 [Clavelina lepadiformis]|uniref:uncharacterized protein LOC143464460 isoform X1 n=1 Tax=Clavelina lepadiformis TaxID=159417 RepID=UPI0040431246